MTFNDHNNTNESLPQKIVFDERQNSLRLRLGIEAFTVFAIAAFLCCASLDFFYRWAESSALVVLLSADLSLAWFIGRSAAKGCMVAVGGKRAQKTAMTFITIGTVLQSMRFFAKLGEENFIVKDGMLTGDFLLFASLLLLFGCGIFSLCVIRREERGESK